MKREDRYKAILSYFERQMPEVTTELEFGSVFQLLVAVILSAQCTDKRINQVTPPSLAAILTPALWRRPTLKTC